MGSSELPVATGVAAPIREADMPAAPQPSGQVSVGMTTQEVKAAWGEPAEITQEEVVDGRVQTWSYGGSRSLQFNANGRLEAVR